jgi:hypothetical protein
VGGEGKARRAGPRSAEEVVTVKFWDKITEMSDDARVADIKAAEAKAFAAKWEHSKATGQVAHNQMAAASKTWMAWA